MSDQFLFAELDGAPPATDRLLFLIYPDLDTAARISERVPDLRAEHGLRGKPVATDRLHITLNHLGDHAGVPRDMVALAREAAETVAARSFDVVFDRIVSFSGKPGNPLPLVLRGDDELGPLLDFQQRLATAMRKTGSRIGKWAESKFTPHVTLLYDRHSVVERAIEPIRWTVSEFVLVHSLVGQTQHVVLGRWPLT